MIPYLSIFITVKIPNTTLIMFIGNNSGWELEKRGRALLGVERGAKRGDSKREGDWSNHSYSEKSLHIVIILNQ